MYTDSYLRNGPAEVYVLAANATLNMPISFPEIMKYAPRVEDPRVRTFAIEVARAFLGAGEAKWWDAQTVVMLSDIIAGKHRRNEGVCANWARQRRTYVDMVWRSQLREGELEPYASIKDSPEADAPLIDYCLRGNPVAMWEEYWAMVNLNKATWLGQAP